MGRYSNQGELASHLGELSTMDPAPAAPSVRKTRKQVQRRLPSAEVDQLVATYEAGAKVRDLASQYGINRSTVLEHTKRAGVGRHHPALTPEEVEEAAR